MMTVLLYEVTPTDSADVCVDAALLTVTAAMASLLPALRAAQIDPAETLR